MFCEKFKLYIYMSILDTFIPIPINFGNFMYIFYLHELYFFYFFD